MTTTEHTDTLVVLALVPSDGGGGLDLLGPAVAQVAQELIQQIVTARKDAACTVTVDQPLGRVTRDVPLADDEDGNPLFFDSIRFSVQFAFTPVTR